MQVPSQITPRADLLGRVRENGSQSWSAGESGGLSERRRQAVTSHGTPERQHRGAGEAPGAAGSSGSRRGGTRQGPGPQPPAWRAGAGGWGQRSQAAFRTGSCRRDWVRIRSERAPR